MLLHVPSVDSLLSMNSWLPFVNSANLIPRLATRSLDSSSCPPSSHCHPISILSSLPLAILLRVALTCIDVGFDSMKPFRHYGLKHFDISFLDGFHFDQRRRKECWYLGRSETSQSFNMARISSLTNILKDIRNLGTYVSQHIPKCRAVVFYTNLNFLSLSIWSIDHSVCSRAMRLIELLVFPDQQASQSKGQKPGEEAKGCTNSHTLNVSWFLIRGKGICSQKRLLSFSKNLT